MFTILQTINKMKSALSVLVSDNIDLEMRIQKIYLSKSTIQLNELKRRDTNNS